jgi:hypothetical protein
MHFDYHFQTDPSGNTNYFVTSTSDLTGTGSSGVKYVAKDSTHYHTVTHSGEASNFTNIEKVKLISQGSTPNMMLRQQTHVVVDQSGNLKANTDKFSVSCK